MGSGGFGGFRQISHFPTNLIRRVFEPPRVCRKLSSNIGSDNAGLPLKEEGQTQEQIAAQLDAEQGTVSKWIPSNIPRNNAASDSRRKLTGNMQTHNAGQTDNRRDDCDLLMPRLAKVAMEPL